MTTDAPRRTRIQQEKRELILEAALEVTNVLDKYYYLTTFEVSAAAGVANAQPGRPREWAVTLKKRF